MAVAVAFGTLGPLEPRPLKVRSPMMVLVLTLPFSVLLLALAFPLLMINPVASRRLLSGLRLLLRLRGGSRELLAVDQIGTQLGGRRRHQGRRHCEGDTCERDSEDARKSQVISFARSSC